MKRCFICIVQSVAKYSLHPNVTDLATGIFCAIYIYAMLTPPGAN